MSRIHFSIKKAILLTLFLSMSGCQPSRMTPVDVSQLLHQLWTDVVTWVARLNEPMVARVNGRRITLGDFKAEYEALKGHSGFASKEGRRRVLEMQIIREVPVAFAETHGLDRGEAYNRSLNSDKQVLLTRSLQDQLSLASPVTEHDIDELYPSEVANLKRFIGPNVSRSNPKVREQLRIQLRYERWNRYLAILHSSSSVWVDTTTLEASFHD